METQELLKRVRKIEIKTRGLSRQIFSGEYHSAFKGRGMAFSEVREYQYGDPIRTIDWNVTARLNHPYVKVFEEEREMNVMLLIDLSGSQFFGTQKTQKKDLAIEIAAVLAFSAAQNNDKVGAILFSDKIEKFIPPKKGRSHILRIIRELVEWQPQSVQTNLKEPLVFLTNALKKRCTAFVLSDFLPAAWEDALKIANRKHDVVALWLQDPLENAMPLVGLLPLQDKETGQVAWVDTSDVNTRKQYQAKVLAWKQKTLENIRKAGVDMASLYTHQSYITALMNLFKRRELKR